MAKVANGWGRPGTSRKWHYFDNDMFSLCRKWGFYFGEAEQGMDDHPDNCAECRKKKLSLDKKRESEGQS